MSLRIQLNLASEPFERTRPVLVAGGAAAFLLTAVLALLIVLSHLETGQSAEMAGHIGRLQARIATLSGEESQLQAVLREPANAEVLARSLLLNSLIYAKAISWTRMFDDLEKVMPPDVRLVQIRPQVNSQNEVSLDMVVAAQASDPVVKFLVALENSPQFGSVQFNKYMPPTQSEPLLRYAISVNYAQKL